MNLSSSKQPKDPFSEPLLTQGSPSHMIRAQETPLLYFENIVPSISNDSYLLNFVLLPPGCAELGSSLIRSFNLNISQYSLGYAAITR